MTTVNVAEMTSDLGWLDMRNNRVTRVFMGCVMTAGLVFVCSTAAMAQDAADTVDQTNTQDRQPTSAVESTAPTDSPPATQSADPAIPVSADDYTPTERISEDRSVSFPVDI